MWDLVLTKYTSTNDKTNVKEPIAMVIVSWAFDGFKNKRKPNSLHVDSDHELYLPEDQS